MKANFTMRASLGTFGGFGLVFGVSSDKEQFGDLILNEVVATVVSNTILVPKDHFTTIVFAVVVA